MAAPLPETIDDVLVRLNRLLDDAIRDGRRIGYFVALYERVTSNVRHALIAGNVFDDGPRWSAWTSCSPTGSSQAWEQHVAGQKPTDSWAVAFERLEDPGPLVIQHLMLGMNAHINLDLGIAAATVAPTRPQLEALHADFNRINDVPGPAGEDRGGAAHHHLPAAVAARRPRDRGGAHLRLRDDRVARRGVEAGAGPGGRTARHLAGRHRAPRRSVSRSPRGRSIRSTASRG